MRHCPVCDARYEDETIKFCTKDGSPLIEGEKPNFVIMPSENEPHDVGEETVIRRRDEVRPSEPERIVIPAMPPEEKVRPRQVYYQPAPEQPNTMKVVALTIIGTLVVLCFGAGLFWLFQKEPASVNMNVNTSPINLNADTNINSLGFNSNFNFNMSTPANYASNYNFNFNMNAFSKTPTNTPTPKQTPTPSPSPLFPSPSPSPRISPVTSPRPPVMTSNRPPSNRN